jgi:hypothetical protein
MLLTEWVMVSAPVVLSSVLEVMNKPQLFVWHNKVKYRLVTCQIVIQKGFLGHDDFLRLPAARKHDTRCLMFIDYDSLDF